LKLSLSIDKIIQETHVKISIFYQASLIMPSHLKQGIIFLTSNQSKKDSDSHLILYLNHWLTKTIKWDWENGMRKQIPGMISSFNSFSIKDCHSLLLQLWKKKNYSNTYIFKSIVWAKQFEAWQKIINFNPL